VIQRLIPQAQRALKSGGWLAMEIGKGQDRGVRELLSSWRDLRFVLDLQGIPRAVAAQRA
jgi:release factor glutamine methyltransferase